MAQLHSTGLYEPSALQYLIDEDILPEDPDPSRYEWSQQLSLDDQDSTIVEEVLRVGHYVVWSRNETIRRVFNLEIEGEPVSHAFVTTFTTSDSISTDLRDSRDFAEPALVVLLKTHAHIFCLSGGFHIIPLPFQVTNAVPCQRGFLLQANTSSQFPSSNDDDVTISMHTTRASFLAEERLPGLGNSRALPKIFPTYCMTELLSDMGIVAASYSRSPREWKSLPLLPSDEELLYTSTDIDMFTEHRSKAENATLAITFNRTTASFTVWQVRMCTARAFPKTSRSSDSAAYRKRQSSNIHERVRLPSTRPAEISRESLGGLIQSFVENQTHTQEPQLSKIESLAAELGHDFEPSGIQTRSARRISSMLARTDLAPSKERSAFNDNLLGFGSRKSLSKSLRKEGSLGSFTDRISFGGRKSFPVAGSVLSNTTSLQDFGNRLSVRDSFVQHVPNEPTLEETNARLQRDAVFVKLKTFVCDESSITANNSDTKVIVIPHPIGTSIDQAAQFQVSVCVHESQAEVMTVITIAVKVTVEHSLKQTWPEMKAVKLQKGSNITSACKVIDRGLQRLFILSKTSHGDDVLHFEAPWSASFRVDLPDQQLSQDTGHQGRTSSTSKKLNRMKRQSSNGGSIRIAQFLSSANLNNVSFADRTGTVHSLTVILGPHNVLITKILKVCKFVLPAHFQDSLLIAYWESSRWLQSQDVAEDLEWMAIAVALFALAVPFIGSLQNRHTGVNRKSKTMAVRTSSTSIVDNTGWSSMCSAEDTRSSSGWTHNPAWAWIRNESTFTTMPKSPTKHIRQASLDTAYNTRVAFILHCTEMAGDFLQSPAGEHMNGPEGYLPTAMNQDRSTRRTSLASIVVALHLLLNELYLEKLTNESLNNEKSKLGSILKQLCIWLSWPSWKSSTQFQDDPVSRDDEEWMYDQGKIDSLDVPPEPFAPHSVFEFIDAALRLQPFKYHSLAELIHSPEELTHNHPSLIASANLLPRVSSIISFFSGDFPQLWSTLSVCENGLQKFLPEAITAACAYKISKSQSRLSNLQPSISSTSSIRPQEKGEKHNLNLLGSTSSHTAVRDVRTIAGQALDAESLSRWDVSSETDRHTITKLIFYQDRRFQEASKLLNQTRAPEIEFDMAPNWTEADALEAQKLLAQYATRRTFSVATGRGMMHFNARMPLLTEMVPVPRFSLQCVMKERKEADSTQPMTFSADRALFTEDKVCWAFFHNGASAGLMISKDANFIDTSWILYNKPSDLTNRHAGFLLALGLNGHLKSLAKWVAFKYLTPKHTMTSIGLLLGLATSYLGTADTRITRLLSVHTTCLLPPGAAELNLSTLTQTAGVVGIGLLYHNTQHRRMSEVMLCEIENMDAEDQINDEPILRDEGYRLAAGISLGLINLGHGLRLHSLHDMRVAERLIAIAVGTKNVNIVHVLDRATAGAVLAIAFIFLKTNDASVARKIDVPDTMHQFDYVRPDVFLLRTLARHLIMWDQIRYTRTFIEESLPPPYRHRADLGNIKRLVTNDLPFLHIIAGVCFAMALRYAGSQSHDARDLLVGYLDHFLRLSRISALSYDEKVTLSGIRNCLDTLALSCAVVMAGSGDLIVFRRLRALHGRTDKDTPFGSHLAAHMAIGALFLSGGTATLGTSNLAIASLIMAFYPLFPVDVLDNRGHLQALRHVWVLAVEPRCLTVRDGSSGQILGNITATLHLTNGTMSLHRTPGLLPELDQIRRITITTEEFWPFELNLEEQVTISSSTNTNKSQTLRERYKSNPLGISVTLHRRALYDKPNLDPFDAELQALDEMKGVPSLTTNSLGPSISQFHSTTPGHVHNSRRSDSPLNWIFSLDAFKHLEHAERALILSGSGQTTPSRTHQMAKDAEDATPSRGSELLTGTPIDTALDLELGTLGPDLSLKMPIPTDMQRRFKSDKLWQIRIMLSWADRVEQENRDMGAHRRMEVESERKWISSQVVEQLRQRIWKLNSSEKENGGADVS